MQMAVKYVPTWLYAKVKPNMVKNNDTVTASFLDSFPLGMGRFFFMG
jgi:hypothetical protein